MFINTLFMSSPDSEKNHRVWVPKEATCLLVLNELRWTLIVHRITQSEWASTNSSPFLVVLGVLLTLILRAFLQPLWSVSSVQAEAVQKNIFIEIVVFQ